MVEGTMTKNKPVLLDKYVERTHTNVQGFMIIDCRLVRLCSSCLSYGNVARTYHKYNSQLGKEGNSALDAHSAAI